MDCMRMAEKRNVAKKEEMEKKLKLAHEGKHDDSLTNFVIFLEGVIRVSGKTDVSVLKFFFFTR